MGNIKRQIRRDLMKRSQGNNKIARAWASMRRALLGDSAYEYKYNRCDPKGRTRTWRHV